MKSQQVGNTQHLSTFSDPEEWAAQFTGLGMKDLRKASTQVIEQFAAYLRSGEVQIGLDKVERLVTSRKKESRLIGGFALETGIVKLHWGERPASWLYSLADDPEWDVREGAQLALKAASESNFEAVSPTLRLWIADQNPNIRRAGIMGCRPKPNLPIEEVEKRLDLIEPLVGDTAIYVKRNMPYVLGFWRTYPKVIMPRLLIWARDPSDTLRRNIALALDGSLANGDPGGALEVLGVLAGDNRRSVRSAVVDATSRLLREYPDVAKLRIEQWKSQPALREVAELVLGRSLSYGAAEGNENG